MFDIIYPTIFIFDCGMNGKDNAKLRINDVDKWMANRKINRDILTTMHSYVATVITVDVGADSVRN